MAGSRQKRRLSTRFTAKEVLGGFGALLLTSDSDLALALADPLEALHEISMSVRGLAESPSSWRIKRSSSWMSSRMSSASSTMPGTGPGNALDAMEGWGGRAKDTVENLL
jgi:hypothetical protein